MARSIRRGPIDELKESDIDAPEAVTDTPFLPGGFIFKGALEDPAAVTTGEDTPAPVGPLFWWEHPTGSKVAVYKNDVYADDGYPYAVGKHINPINGGEPHWTLTHIAKTWEDAIRSAEGVADHRKFLIDSNTGETYSEWVDRTGGTAYERSVPWDDEPAAEKGE